MPTIRSVLSADERPHVIQRTAMALEAARQMSQENIGALVVLDGDQLVGIFTERDLMKRIVAQGKDPSAVRVGDVMTTQVALGDPNMTVEEALRVMKQARCRHLPIVEEGKLLAIVSVRDLIEIDWTEKKQEIDWLKEYIQYSPPPQP